MTSKLIDSNSKIDKLGSYWNKRFVKLAIVKGMKMQLKRYLDKEKIEILKKKKSIKIIKLKTLLQWLISKN